MNIIDNTSLLLGDDLKATMGRGARLKIAASCFSIYAFEALKAEFSKVESLQFIFTAPTFIATEVTDRLSKERREFFIPKATRERGLYGTEFEIQLRNKLTQRAVARECADWIRKKAHFRSNTTRAPMQQFIHLGSKDGDVAYMPISGFTAVDLGYQKGDAVSNLVTRVDDVVHTQIYLQLFNQIWNDEEKVSDVTVAICDHIESVYQENSPERIYFHILYNLFQDFLEEVDQDALPNDLTGYKDSLVWNKLFNYQKDAATGIINKLEMHNGCILADSVGLGKTFAGTNAYLYLEGIEISKKAPMARLEIEVKLASGEIKRQLKRLEFGRNLFDISEGLDQYRDGFTISQIDARIDTVEFTNGLVLQAGEATGDVSERDIRRIQIREAIKAHLDKEKQLFAEGIKVLSLFFIDEVVKYRDYAQSDEKGEYARVFEEEYELLKAEYLAELAIDNDAYRKHLVGIETAKTHNGYFSIDKRTNRLKDPVVGARSVDSDDVDAYDLILKDKERLLSFTEPTRFIFSHSALREGWDNPNVFVICMLKHSDNTVSRRQEVGRGLRLSVDQNGDRMDNPAVVHDINVLTVVASESYKNFVAGLQKEIADTLTSRPRKATEDYFTGKTIATDTGPLEISPAMAKQIYRYLVRNDYSDDADQITNVYHEAKEAGTLAALPDELKPHADQIFQIIDSVFSDAQVPRIDDGRKPKTNPLNDNFEKKEFQELWRRINQKAVYRVEFESDELVRKCVSALDGQLRITPLRYTIQTGIQREGFSDEELQSGESFDLTGSTTERGGSVHSLVKYDLLGKIAENAELTRKTAASILTSIQSSVFAQFKENPEHFIAEASRIIAEQKATMVIERLTYDGLSEHYDTDIFTANQTSQDFSGATAKLKRHVYDYVVTQSDIERKFAVELDTSSEVVVYVKLPRGFLIPTPVGDYNPDWAISFKEGSVKHIYFVAETKGTMSSMKLREIENTKIACARRFFDEIGKRVTEDRVKYDVVTSYDKLMDIVGRSLT